MTFQELQEQVKSLSIVVEENSKKLEELTLSQDKLEELSNNTKNDLERLTMDFVAFQEAYRKIDSLGFKDLQMKLVIGTTDATSGTESTHPHLMTRIPQAIWILPTSNGVIYQSKAPDETNIYLKGSANSLTFIAICLI